MPLGLSHFHIGVKRLDEIKQWFAEVMEQAPAFANERLAYFVFGEVTVVFETASSDVPMTLAFATDDCDGLYEQLVARGAESDKVPKDQTWGVRSAYFKGPGAITVEIEQSLRSTS